MQEDSHSSAQELLEWTCVDAQVLRTSNLVALLFESFYGIGKSTVPESE